MCVCVVCVCASVCVGVRVCVCIHRCVVVVASSRSSWSCFRHLAEIPCSLSPTLFRPATKHVQAEAAEAERRREHERTRTAARRQAKVVADQMKRASDAARGERAEAEAEKAERNRRRQQAIRSAAQVGTRE